MTAKYLSDAYEILLKAQSNCYSPNSYETHVLQKAMTYIWWELSNYFNPDKLRSTES